MATAMMDMGVVLSDFVPTPLVESPATAMFICHSIGSVYNDSFIRAVTLLDHNHGWFACCHVAKLTSDLLSTSIGAALVILFSVTIVKTKANGHMPLSVKVAEYL
jgi:hypothetical protein